MLCRTILGAAILTALFSSSTFAQQKPDVAGDYSGTLGPIHLKLHIKAGTDGTLTGTLDSPDQGANGIPCSDFHFDGKELSFSVPAVHGSWQGSVSPDGQSLAGTWNQGSPLPLTFTREQAFVPAAKPSRVDGVWLGAIHEASETLRIQLQLKSDASGKEYCTLDSLDQEATDIPCSNVLLEGNKFSFDIPPVHAQWSGTISADGKALTGTWTQGNPTALNLERQATAIVIPPVPPPSYQPAMPPVTLAQLQSVLNKDLEEALKSGVLAPSTQAGVTIGVVDHGQRQIFSYGVAKNDSIFEIGSITKTFTGLILSQMVEQGKVKFDDPVRELLPEGTVAKPTGDEITLLDLATQHSGLPRMPDNFNPADKNNPYADYTAADMYAFIKKQGVTKPAKTEFLYSNLGFGLLGQALADRAGTAYPQLLQHQITTPLAMQDTVVTLSAEQQSRFIAGHDPHRQPAHAWDLVAFAGAGAIRSTAADMLTYLEANLHPDKLPSTVTATPDGKTLAAALAQSHELHNDAMSGLKIALAWLYDPETENYWHNGATGGYSGYVVFNQKNDYAVVVLVNNTVIRSGSIADQLGQHITERLTGKPALEIK
jgi:D-alanyl-D-alanine-carboxypeptidase/D-alanyl-D-alanine-endopeptidase